MSKKIVIYPLVLGIAAIAAFAALTDQEGSAEQKYEPRGVYNEALGADGAREYNTMLRRSSATGGIDPALYKLAQQEAKAFGINNTNKALGYQWHEEGPDNIGGRTRTILIDQDDPNIVYCGGVSGALFKSVNGGNVWTRVPGYSGSSSISKISQTANGNLYVATGNRWESFGGDGLWFSEDGGATFQEFPDSDTWGDISDMIVKENTVYAATFTGLRVFDAGVNTTTTFAPDVPQGGEAYSIDIGPQGQVIVAIFATGKTWMSTDGGLTFTNITLSGGLPAKIPSVGSRGEVAISPDDNNYIYISMVSGSNLQGVFKTSDMGANWSAIAPGGGSFDPFSFTVGQRTLNQGTYDHCISVRPGNKDEVWIGGIIVYAYKNNQWEQQTVYGGFGIRSVHPDIHDFQWAPDGGLYIGTDGGVYRTYNDGGDFIYYGSNRGLNITQFYEIDFDVNGKILGGTQDNSCLYLHRSSPHSWKEATGVYGGDGIATNISHMNPNIMFASSQRGDFARSAGGGFSGFGDSHMDSLKDATGSVGQFRTEFELFEKPYDPQSLATVAVQIPDTTADDTTFVINGDTLHAIYLPGDTLRYKSNTNETPFIHFVSDTIWGGELLHFQDPVQSLFAVGYPGSSGTLSNGIWVTRHAMQFNVVEPDWFLVANAKSETTPDVFTGTPNCMTFTTPDGNYLFVGTTGGDLYRISGLRTAYHDSLADVRWPGHLTKCTKIRTGNFVQPVTGIAVDRHNVDHVVISLGGTVTGSHVLETNNATDTTMLPIWSDIHGPGATGLPNTMACYDVEIEQVNTSNGMTLIVGTEFGIYATDDGGITWSEENDGMERVPTYTVKQQWRTWEEGAFFPGMIYIGTYGRGVFRNDKFLAIDEQESPTIDSKPKAELKIYPNPVRDNVTVEITAAQREKAVVRIFDLQGKIAKSEEFMLSPGTQKVSFDTFAMRKGTYFVNVSSNSMNESAQMVVVK